MSASSEPSIQPSADPSAIEPFLPADFAARPFSALDELIWKVSWDARPKYRGGLHAISAFLAPPAAIAIAMCAKPGKNRVAAGVYGAGLCAMFAASGAYHRLTKSRRMANIMRRVDHSMIYVMIAGTWTPIAVATLPPKQAKAVLAAVWSAAALAAGTKVVRLGESNRAGSWFYPVLGIAGVVLAPAVVRVGGKPALASLAAGGIAYLGGAAIFAAQRPNPWPKKFGFHEIFHTTVVLGVLSQYAAIWRILRRTR
ncbi:MAG: hemolysin III family protein [Acidimicrobiales bacterium]